MSDTIKKLNRLIENKRQRELAYKRDERVRLRIIQLKKERDKILNSFTDDEVKLYKDRIEKAYHDHTHGH